MLARGCVLPPSWAAGEPGGSSLGLWGQKPAAIQRFFNLSTDGGSTNAQLFVTVLRLCLGTKLLSDSSYAKKRKLWRVRKVSSAATTQTPCRFFFIQSHAHFSSTAF